MERIENNWKELKRIVRKNGNKLNRIERIMGKNGKMKRIENNWKELKRIARTNEKNWKELERNVKNF